MENQDVKKQTDAFLKQIQAGDISALDGLYEITHRIFFLLCYSYFQNHHDSEDALHNVYLTVVKNISKYSGVDGFNWMFTITKNTCLNLIKKNKKTIATDLTDEENINALGADQGSELYIFDESGIVSLSREILKQHEFRIVILHALQGMKFGDIARGLGKLESTVRWQYNNAIKKVRTEYERRQGI